MQGLVEIGSDRSTAVQDSCEVLTVRAAIAGVAVNTSFVLD
jgi:hypothetical protein